MSLALIEESSKEVRRLAVAGSALAVGDFRLKRLIQPLEQSGVKVPVFAQVAKSIGELVNGTESESATRLLGLSTLLNAILYTQGQSCAAGELRELETFASNSATTKATARALKPVILALTTTGAGRLEVVRSAAERGLFKDPRLIDSAIRALEDSFPELAELVAKRILPEYGPGILPRLKVNLDLKGKGSDARKLGAIHRLDPEGSLELCKTALAEGSPDLRVTAIACLGEHESCLPLVLEHVNSKNKAIRSAALEALADHDRPEISAPFEQLIHGKTLDLLAGPFRRLRSRQVLGSMLAEGDRVFQLVVGGDADSLHRFSQVLDCLEYRKDSEVGEFLIGCFEQSSKLSKVKVAKTSAISAVDLVERLGSLLCSIGLPKALEALLGKRAELPPSLAPKILRAAVLTWTPERFFEEYSPLFAVKRGAGRHVSDHLQELIIECRSYAEESFDPVDNGGFLGDDPGALKNVHWDPRWLDAAISADLRSVVCCLARPNHKTALKYLLEKSDLKDSYDGTMTVQALVDCGYAEVTDYFLDRVAKWLKRAKSMDYDLHTLFSAARHLPPSDLPKLEKFAAGLEAAFADDFLAAIEPLRRPKETT